MVTKVGKVRQIGCDFRKVANRDGAVNSQSVRFEKYMLFLEPREEVASRASKFNAAEAAVTKNVAADADLSCIVAFNAGGGDFEVFFEFCFRGWHRSRRQDDLVVVGWCSEY